MFESDSELWHVDVDDIEDENMPVKDLTKVDMKGNVA